MNMSEKYAEKRLLKMFLTEYEVLMGKRYWSRNISARSLTLLIFAVGWALCSRPQPEHESMMPLLSLSPLNASDARYCKPWTAPHCRFWHLPNVLAR